MRDINRHHEIYQEMEKLQPDDIFQLIAIKKEIYFSKFLFLFNLYFVAVNSFKKSSNVSISSLVPIVILK